MLLFVVNLYYYSKWPTHLYTYHNGTMVNRETVLGNYFEMLIS